MQAASRVGALLVAFILLVYGAYMFIGKPILTPKSDVYYANFPDAGGIPAGTRILMAGVQIGSVESIELVNFEKAKVAMRILAPHRIPKNAVAVINSSFTGLGDNPIVILPPEHLTDLLAPGETISGSKAGALDRLLPGAPALSNEMTKTLKATREILEDKKMIHHIDELMVSSNAALQKFGQLADKFGAVTGHADSVIADNQADIKEIMRNLALTTKNVNESSTVVAKLLKSGKLTDKSAELLDGLNETVAQTQELVGQMNDLIGDPKFKSSIKKTMANVETITDSGTRIAANADKISAKAITVTDNMATLTNKASGLADSAHELLDKLNHILDKSPIGGKSSGDKKLLGGIQTDASLNREFNPNRWRTDFDVKVPNGTGFFTLGLYDAFEGNKVNAQIGKNFGTNADIRAGAYAGKPGLGFDYRYRPGLTFRGDLFDLNKPRFDFRTKFDVSKDFYGWLGIQDIGAKNQAMVGIGIRK